MPLGEVDVDVRVAGGADGFAGVRDDRAGCAEGSGDDPALRERSAERGGGLQDAELLLGDAGREVRLVE